MLIIYEKLTHFRAGSFLEPSIREKEFRSSGHYHMVMIIRNKLSMNYLNIKINI